MRPQMTVTYELQGLDFRNKTYTAETQEGELKNTDPGELSSLFSTEKVELCAIVNRVKRTHAILLDAQWKLLNRNELTAALRATGVLSKVPRKDMRCICGSPTRKDGRILWHKDLAIIVGCDECADVSVPELDDISDTESHPWRVILSDAPYPWHVSNQQKTRQLLRLKWEGQLYVMGESEGMEGQLYALKRIKGRVGRKKGTAQQMMYLMEALEFGNVVVDKESGERHFAQVEPVWRIAQAVADKLGSEFQRLKAIVHIPTLTADGRILSQYGYDEASQLFVDPPSEMQIDNINDEVTEEDRTWAKDFIDDFLFDFPFVDDGAKSAAVAMMLEQVVRHALLEGRPCPAYVCCAPDPGTGKSLLAKLAQTIIEGRHTPTQYTDDEIEMDKRLLSIFQRGQAFIIFDDIAGEVRSSHLASALTATTYSSRFLGKSEMLVVDISSTIVLTLNNARLKADISRRCVMIDLDEKARPTKLGPDGRRIYHCDSVHDCDIETYVRRNRPQLIRALLILAKAWVDAGRPVPEMKMLDSYEEWCKVLGGIVTHAGYTGFADVIHRAQRERNADRVWSDALVTVLYNWRGTPPFNTTDIGRAVALGGLWEKLGYKTEPRRSDDSYRAVGRTVVDTKLSDLKRPVEVRPGAWMGLVELDRTPEGHRIFQLRLIKGELPHVIPTETDMATSLQEYQMMGGDDA